MSTFEPAMEFLLLPFLDPGGCCSEGEVNMAWIAGVAALPLAAGIGFQLWRLGLLGAPPAAVAGEWVLASQFNDLKGNPQPLAQWRGKVVVVNWWATWCAPCREEMPIFVKLQEKYGERGLICVGLAVDQPRRVESFARDLGINYPLLIGDVASLDLASKVGNTAGGILHRGHRPAGADRLH